MGKHRQEAKPVTRDPGVHDTALVGDEEFDVI